MKKRFIDKLHEKKESKEYGIGTVVCQSWEEFEKFEKDIEGGFLSPGGAAGRLGVSRAYIHLLEKEGKLRAFRIWNNDKIWEHLPIYMKIIVPKREVFIFIPTEDVKKIRQNMLRKAENKIKRLEVA